MSTVRVDEHLHTMLRSIAREEGRSIGSVIEDAVERYRREKFWASVQDGYARLQTDPEQWAAYQQEIDLWDTMAGDGLEGEAPYGTDEEGAKGDVTDTAVITDLVTGPSLRE